MSEPVKNSRVHPLGCQTERKLRHAVKKDTRCQAETTRQKSWTTSDAPESRTYAVDCILFWNVSGKGSEGLVPLGDKVRYKATSADPLYFQMKMFPIFSRP